MPGPGPSWIFETSLAGPVPGFLYGYGLNYFEKSAERSESAVFDDGSKKTYGRFDGFIAWARVCVILMLGLSITGWADRTLSANSHALIC